MKPAKFFYDSENAALMAALSQAVYEETGDAARAAMVAAYQSATGGGQANVHVTDDFLPESHPFRRKKLRAGVLASKDISVLVFRGTIQEGENWAVNMGTAFAWTDIGKVHEGFNDAIDAEADAAITSVVETMRDENGCPPLFLTGHSLGGAMATIYTARRVLGADKTPTVRALYTFGAPRVGDKDFAKRLGRAFDGRLWRLVNREDIVPTIPPARMGPISFGLYRHTQGAIWFESENDPKWRIKWSRENLTGNTTDHSIGAYIDAVRANPDFVPYEPGTAIA